MDKKPLIPLKFLLKLETALIIAISFFLLHTFGKKEQDAESVEEKSSESFEAAEVSEVKNGVFFDSEIFKVTKKLIQNSKESVVIATYTYSKSPLTEILEQKQKEGVKVKVLAGKNRDGHVPRFDFFENKQKNGIYHPKFMVFDSKGVLISSSNISSEKSASNSAVFFENAPAAAKILEEEVEDSFAQNFQRRCETGCETEIGTIIFNPGKGCILAKNEFSKAEKSIKGGIYTFTSKNPVVTGLKNALKKNIYVSIVVDNWRGNDGKIVNKRALNYLSSKGATLRFDEPEQKNETLFHHKFAVIDSKTTLFGSMNWTASGCYKNREIVVINRDPQIAKQFENYFDSFNR
ncbi:MAG: phospholipase D-like domain-containing protein [bacterium]